MSKAKIKKILQGMTADQLSELVVELYDVRKEAREYLEYWADPQPEKWIKKTKKEIRYIFNLYGEIPRRRPSLSDLNTIVKHFLTLGMDREYTADVLLYVAEIECEWLEQRYRRLSYRASMMKNLEAARLYIENAYPENETNPYGIRLDRLQDQVSTLFYYR